MNLCVLSGYVGKEPDNRTTQSGKAMATFTLGVKRPFSKEDVTDWFNCTAFNSTAEFIEKYIHKGSKVTIQGVIQNDHYEKDGVKHYNDKILVNNIEPAESKKSEQNTEQAAPEQKSDDGFMDIPEISDEELPFA